MDSSLSAYTITETERWSTADLKQSPRDVLEGKSGKNKIAWPKNSQPKML
jgi:hypothetical protein